MSKKNIPIHHSGIESRAHGRNQDSCDQLIANILVATNWSRLSIPKLYKTCTQFYFVIWTPKHVTIRAHENIENDWRPSTWPMSFALAHFVKLAQKSNQASLLTFTTR